MYVFYVMQLKQVSDFCLAMYQKKMQNGNTRKTVACLRAHAWILFPLQVFMQDPSAFFSSALRAVSCAHKPLQKKYFWYDPHALCLSWCVMGISGDSTWGAKVHIVTSKLAGIMFS